MDTVKLDSSLAIDFAHVYDVINVLFPEVIEGVALTVTVNDEEITVLNNAMEHVTTPRYWMNRQLTL